MINGMTALDIIKNIEGIDEEERNSITERYLKGQIFVLSVADELEELIKENDDVSYLEYTEQLQQQYTHLVQDNVGDDFWFVSM